MSELIIIVLIIMTGLLLSIVAWQIFAIGKTVVSKVSENDEELKTLIQEFKSEIELYRQEFEQLNAQLDKSGQN